MNIDFEKSGGLVPAVVQEQSTGKLLMLAYMNQVAFEKTNECGLATFYSRSRDCLWTKGETSGNGLKVLSMKLDCDGDTILLMVERLGDGVCHEGTLTCFNYQWEENRWVRLSG